MFGLSRTVRHLCFDLNLFLLVFSNTSCSAARALEADTERLEHECQAYTIEVKARQERLKGLERNLAPGLFLPSFNDPQGDTIERSVDLSLD